MYSCYSCYSMLECWNLFSKVKLSISVLFYLFVHRLLGIFLIFVGVELPLCIGVIVVTLSWNAMTIFYGQVEYKRSVLFICSQATTYFLHFGAVELSLCMAVIVVTLS